MMASTTLAAHSASPSANLPSYNGLRHYYKVRNFQIVGGHNRSTMSATSVDPGDQCPDTSKWPSADNRNSEYVVAQHVAMAVSAELAKKYPIVRCGHGAQDLNATDGPSANVYANVVKYMIQSSKNLQDKDETDYFLKIEVNAPQFKYIIAHVVVTPEHLSILYQTWTTST